MMGHALLGRTEIERGNWDQAIVALNRGLSSRNTRLAFLRCWLTRTPQPERLPRQIRYCSNWKSAARVTLSRLRCFRRARGFEAGGASPAKHP